MANIRGAIGFNPSTGTARLLAAFGQDIVNVATGTGYSLNLNTTNDVEFERFLDRIFFQNNSETPKTYNTTTNVWTQEYVGRTPRSKYLKRYKSRMYLGYCQFTNPEIPTDGNNAFTFPSRVFYSDLFTGSTPIANLTWGIEWGTNGSILGLTNLFRVESQASGFPLVANFRASNIKVGDPLFITNYTAGSPQNPSTKGYLVTRVEDYRLTLDSALNTGSATDGLNFWVGSNWFDVAPDDGDVITGFGENSDRLLIFKLMSLWYYTGNQLKQVNGALGTSYNRSIVNDRYGNTYYFHGSNANLTGIYKYNGVSSVKISRAVDPWIAAMSTANYSAVVAWANGNELCWYLGNLSTSNYLPQVLTNVVVKYNVDTQAWSIDLIQDVITASTTWRVSGVENPYLGTNDNQIIKIDSSTSDNTAPITSLLQTKVIYPAGSEIICDFPYIQVIGRNLQGVRIKFRLWDDPTYVDQEWSSLGECRGDKTEFALPPGHFQASGIQFQIDEMDSAEKDWYVEKISVFYRPDRRRLL